MWTAWGRPGDAASLREVVVMRPKRSVISRQRVEFDLSYDGKNFLILDIK